MEYAGKQVLIFAGPDFEDRELIYPYYRFQEGGATVTVAGLGETFYHGKHGVPIETQGRFEDFVNDTFDLVVIPGGWAPDAIRTNLAALDIVKKAAQKQLPIGAICHGGSVLASAQVVSGKKVTSYASIKDDLIHAGAHWQDSEVVVDGFLVTARQPADLPAFCRELGKLLVRQPVGV